MQFRRVANKRYILGKNAPANTTARFVADMADVTRDQLSSALRKVVIDEVAKQERLDNPPNQIIVDGSSTKPFAQAERKVVVRFGQTVDPLMITAVERTLLRNIRRTTGKKSGSLRNIKANWGWFLYDTAKGKRSKAVKVNPKNLPALSLTQRLVLKPTNVTNKRGEPYASAVNNAVARRGTSRNDRRYRRRDGPVPQITEKKGFIGMTSRDLKRQPYFRRFFWVRAVQTKAFQNPGEVAKYGTWSIVIGVRLSGARGRRLR